MTASGAGLSAPGHTRLMSQAWAVHEPLFPLIPESLKIGTKKFHGLLGLIIKP
jgi:hypothetical protein